MAGEGMSEGGMGGGGGETPQEGESGRVRAWVLVEAKKKSARETAEELCGHDGGEKYTIVRADLVRGAAKKIVVPVDASSPPNLQVALGKIQEITDDDAPTVINVTEHHPNPPDGACAPGITGNNAWG